MNDIATAIAAAQVLSFRLPMLWAMALSPTPARRAEALKMIVEKQMAAAEAVNAMALSGLLAWMKFVSGESVSMQQESRKVVEASLRPVRRRVGANARRLKRRKRI